MSHQPIQMCTDCYSWSELTVWPRGVHVKHVKGLFKAEGINNTAEPGNSTHSKFYVSHTRAAYSSTTVDINVISLLPVLLQFMFKQPEYVCAIVAILSVCCTVCGFALLFYFTHWYQQLATAGLVLTNYYSIFVSIRDYMILTRVYG